MPHPRQHLGGLVVRVRPVERDVARREPHVLVTELVGEARLVACVRLEQTPIEVRERSAGNRLDHVILDGAAVDGADEATKALDGADASEDDRDRRRDAAAEQQSRLREVRVARRPLVERRLGDLGAERGAVIRLPGGDRRVTARGPRRQVSPGTVEAAVATPTIHHDRLGDRIGREQLGLGPLELQAHEFTVRFLHAVCDISQRRISTSSTHASTIPATIASAAPSAIVRSPLGEFAISITAPTTAGTTPSSATVTRIRNSNAGRP